MDKANNNIQKPLISVVMATYNGERFIREAIDSILNQSFSNFEFIIVNDGSADATEQIIKSYKDKRIAYIKKDFNTGIADSLNIGIEAATGTYIARMDDDDVSMPQRFEKQLEVFIKNQNIVVCGSNVLLNNDVIRANPEKHNSILMQLLFKNPMVHPSVMIRKKVLSDIKYDKDKVPSEDYDLWSRLIFKGQFHNIQIPLLFYRYSHGSETSTRRKEQLNLNVPIAILLFKKLNLETLRNHDFYLKAFVSHDYIISGYKLKGLINWFQELKIVNNKEMVFECNEFNTESNKYLVNYLIAYFTNRSLPKKIVPFILMRTKYKIEIINYYLKKNQATTKSK